MVQLGSSSWVNVPPPTCPACGWAWPITGPDRPSEDFMGCSCAGVEPGRRGHTRWTCLICDAVVAEGCVDIELWHADTTPVGLPRELRWTAPEVE
jgi:hypothetical protein